MLSDSRTPRSGHLTQPQNAFKLHVFEYHVHNVWGKLIPVGYLLVIAPTINQWPQSMIVLSLGFSNTGVITAHEDSSGACKHFQSAHCLQAFTLAGKSLKRMVGVQCQHLAAPVSIQHGKFRVILKTSWCLLRDADNFCSLSNV